MNRISRISCYSDSKEVIVMIKDGVGKVHIYGPLVRRIKELAASLERCSFNHILRECNQVADSLACRGVRRSEDFLEDGGIPDLESRSQPQHVPLLSYAT